MPDALGHSWAGLGPRTCRDCGAVEGSKAVWEPCSRPPSKRPAETLIEAATAFVTTYRDPARTSGEVAKAAKELRQLCVEQAERLKEWGA